MESFLKFFVEYRHNLKTGLTSSQGMEAPSVHPDNRKGNNITRNPLDRKHPGLADPYKPTVVPGIYGGQQMSDVLANLGVELNTLQSKGVIKNCKNSWDCHYINGVAGPMIKISKSVKAQPQLN